MEEDDEDDTRASEDGPVPAKMTFTDWLKTQPDEFARDILGPVRFSMYKDGMELSGFVAGGKMLTLKQLEAADGLPEPSPPKFEVVSDEMKDKLQEQSNATYSGFSENERKGIDFYSDDGYTKINNSLFGTIPTIPEIEDNIKYLDSIMISSTVQNDLITFRGTEARHFADWNVNDVREFKAFMSTSVSKEIVEKEYLVDYSDKMLIEVMVPNGTKGIYLGTNSSCNWEAELLLNRGMKYKVLEKTDHTMKLLVQK
jgi:hypothetical protein